MCDARILTKEDDDVIVFFKYIFQHFAINFLYLPWNFKSIFISDPRQYFILVLDVTLVNQRVFVPEEGQRGEGFDSVFLRESSIFCGNEDDPRLV